jgi:hypothetical protein
VGWLVRRRTSAYNDRYPARGIDANDTSTDDPTRSIDAITNAVSTRNDRPAGIPNHAPRIDSGNFGVDYTRAQRSWRALRRRNCECERQRALGAASSREVI